MKKLATILAGAMMYTLMAGSAFAVNTSCNDWNLTMDFLRASTQPKAIIPDLCGTPRWFFMDSVDQTNTPSKYKLLDTNPATLPQCAPGTGMLVWTGAAGFPLVYANASYESQFCSGYLPEPPATTYVHPGPSSAAVVGWKSTFTGKVQMEVNLGDFDTACGDGQSWYIQKGATKLASGTVTPGKPASWKNSGVSVKAGDFLYVGVGPGANGDYYCDTTNLDITVTRLP